jgi:hypothetical protein
MNVCDKDEGKHKTVGVTLYKLKLIGNTSYWQIGKYQLAKTG